MAIRFENVKLKNILDIESLIINDNDCICITGRNGSGKSTFCNLLATIYYPDSGKIFIDGKDITKFETCPVAMTMQNPKMQVVKSIVSQDIAFGLENKNMCYKDMENQINKSINFFNLQELKNKETSKISGGQLQRVLFAAIDVLDNDIYIFDEPLAMIDEDNRNIFYKYINILKSKGKTIIIVSHILSKELKCNRHIVFDKGKIISDNIYNYINNKENLLSFTNQYNISKDSILTIENLTFSYSYNTIFNNINLGVKDKEIVGICGETGSGKSTLLNLIIGLIKTDKIKKNCEVSFALQHPQDQICNVKVIDEVSYNLIAKGWDQDKAKERAKYVLDRLNPLLIDKDVYEISQGQLRLVTIASSIASNSRLILLDEITAHLDDITIDKVFTLIKEENLSCIMVSHDIHILLKECDSIYKIINKKLVKVVK